MGFVRVEGRNFAQEVDPVVNVSIVNSGILEDSLRLGSPSEGRLRLGVYAVGSIFTFLHVQSSIALNFESPGRPLPLRGSCLSSVGHRCRLPTTACCLAS